MNELRDALWDSFMAEVDLVMAETGAIFTKPEINDGELEVVFRAFHNIKSNAKLLDLSRLSDTASLGEEISRVLIKQASKRKNTVVDHLRDAYEHTRYQFEYIKSRGIEPLYQGLDHSHIKAALYTGEGASSHGKYSASEINMFIKIVSGNISQSLLVPDNRTHQSVIDAIVLMREASLIMEFYTLATLYEELYESRKKLSGAPDVFDSVTPDIASRIYSELTRIKIENGMDFPLERMAGVLLP